MATTAQKISIRNCKDPTAFPALSGDTFYHGTIAVISGAGYIENFDSSSLGCVPVVVDNINGGYDSAGTASTGTGSVVNGQNLVTAYTDGLIDSIPFNSDAAATSVGQVCFVKDNFTLTMDPADGVMPFGVVTKFYTTTKAEVQIGSYATDGIYTLVSVIDGAAANTSNLKALANPIGRTVMIKDWTVYVSAAASSVCGMAMGIAATSTTVSINLAGKAVGAITLGSISAFGAGQTTDFATNVKWTSSEYLTFTASSGCSTAGGTSTLVAYVKLRYEVL
jgi:hypothetical protein